MKRFFIESGVGGAILSFGASTGGPSVSGGSTAGLRRTAGPPPLSHPSSGGSAGIRGGRRGISSAVAPCHGTDVGSGQGRCVDPQAVSGRLACGEQMANPPPAARS